MDTVDIAIIGSGMVGASIAFHAAPKSRVLLLEGESAAGYHSTGRSAAVFAETYGPPGVRALTRASRAFYESPPEGFAASPLLLPRGALFVGRDDQRDQVLAEYESLAAEGSDATLIDTDAAIGLVPVLKPEAAAAALIDRDALDIDVDLLLQGFLRGARAAGAEVVTGARVSSLDYDDGAWSIGTRSGDLYRARTLVNCAGAWADELGRLAGAASIGLQPRRRSAFIFEPPTGMATDAWPLVVAIDESWYFKPDAGMLLGSPANADPVAPHDVVAEEFDIALGIHHIEEATTMRIHRPKHTWAGLRSFVADGEPVLGFDPGRPDFFWAAGLGGYGIQTAPAMGRFSAALLSGEAMPADISRQGADPALFAADRAGLTSA